MLFRLSFHQSLVRVHHKTFEGKWLECLPINSDGYNFSRQLHEAFLQCDINMSLPYLIQQRSGLMHVIVLDEFKIIMGFTMAD